MFIIKTSISTCFRHHYAHYQENNSVHCRIWCSALLVMAVVAWSWDVSCVHCEGHCSNSDLSNSDLHSAHSLRPSSTQLGRKLCVL